MEMAERAAPEAAGLTAAHNDVEVELRSEIERQAAALNAARNEAAALEAYANILKAQEINAKDAREVFLATMKQNETLAKDFLGHGEAVQEKTVNAILENAQMNAQMNAQVSPSTP